MILDIINEDLVESMSFSLVTRCLSFFIGDSHRFAVKTFFSQKICPIIPVMTAMALNVIEAEVFETMSSPRLSHKCSHFIDKNFIFSRWFSTGGKMKTTHGVAVNLIASRSFPC